MRDGSEHESHVAKASQCAVALKRLRKQAGMTVRSLAEAIGRPASSYATYENEYKKPYLPMDLVLDLEPVLTARGVLKGDLYALGGAPSVSESPEPPAAIPYDPDELREVIRAIFVIFDPAKGADAFAEAVIEAYERISMGKLTRGRGPAPRRLG